MATREVDDEGNVTWHIDADALWAASMLEAEDAPDPYQGAVRPAGGQGAGVPREDGEPLGLVTSRAGLLVQTRYL